MKWFTDCKCIEDVKSLYYKLARKYHPDICGGTAESEKIMKEINAEYEVMAARYKDIHRNESGEYVKAQKESPELPEEFQKIINGVIHMNGIKIELVGIFVWITGNTYPYREELKRIGFKWGNKKKAWYWHPAYYVHYNKYPKHKNLDELKRKWGSETIETEDQKQIA